MLYIKNKIPFVWRIIDGTYAGLISFPGNDCVVVVTSASGKK